MKLCIVLGTRPEIIKMSSLIFACQKRNVPFALIHTGQHYSYNLDQLFFDELQLPRPDYHLRLSLSSNGHAEQVGKMLLGLEPVLQKEQPSVVLVEGDTNSVLAGALCAAKLHIPVGHVEAGLRSYDRTMPEEINRVITDHLSTYLYAPTSHAKATALQEGISPDSLSVTGNTIVDAVHAYKKQAQQSTFLEAHHLEKQRYFLVTAHRAENVDNKVKLQHIFDGLDLLAQHYGDSIIYPIHPRTKKFISLHTITVPKTITLLEPIGFFDFLQAEMYAQLVLTDSGGVQEESCILGVPCVTLRENTERPETLQVGSNVLAGTDPKKILTCVVEMLKKKPVWKHPFGDGNAGKLILDHLTNTLS